MCLNFPRFYGFQLFSKISIFALRPIEKFLSFAVSQKNCKHTQLEHCCTVEKLWVCTVHKWCSRSPRDFGAQMPRWNLWIAYRIFRILQEQENWEELSIHLKKLLRINEKLMLLFKRLSEAFECFLVPFWSDF